MTLADLSFPAESELGHVVAAYRLAAEVAMATLSAVSVDDVAARIEDALRALDQDDLAARAGPTRYGYTEPTQAADFAGEATEASATRSSVPGSTPRIRG